MTKGLWVFVAGFALVWANPVLGQETDEQQSDAAGAGAGIGASGEVSGEASVEDDSAQVEDAPAETNAQDSGAQANTASTTADQSTEDAGGHENPAYGKWGVGYFTTSAPFGVRRWFTDDIGFDAGVGFNIATAGGNTTWGVGAEAGLLYALAHLQNIIVFVRGGLGLGFDDPGPGVNVGVNINGMLGGEFFLTELGFPNLSLSGGVGAQINLDQPNGGDFGFEFTTTSAPVNVVTSAVLGFHIYF